MEKLEFTSSPKNREGAEAVESFFIGQAPLFQASHEAWRAVKEQQAAIQGYYGEVENRKLEGVNRQTRRRGRAAPDFKTLVGALRNSGEESYRRAFRVLIDQPASDAEKLRAMNEALLATAEGTKAHTDHALAAAPALTPEFITTTFELTNSYTRAFFTDELALSKVRQLLQDGELAAPFTERIQEIAKFSRSGLHEFPGLLSLVATDVKRKGNESVLHEAVWRTAQQPSAHDAAELIDSYMAHEANEQKGKRQDVELVGLLRLTAVIMRDSFGLTFAESAAKFAERLEQWGPELRHRLERHISHRTQHQWEQLKATLEPYAQAGRIPLAGQVLSVPDEALSPRHKKAKGKRPRLPTAPKAQPIDVISEEQEPPQVTQFALLKSADEQGSVEPMASLEALFDTPIFSRYLTKYNEPNLPEALLESLRRLAAEPYSHAMTDRVQKTGRMRRLQLSHIPGMSNRGPIAARTCIDYSLHIVEGQPCIAINNVFLIKN